MKQKKVIILTKEEVEVVNKVFEMADKLCETDNEIVDVEDAMHHLCDFFEDFAFNEDITKCQINETDVVVEED